MHAKQLDKSFNVLQNFIFVCWLIFSSWCHLRQGLIVCDVYSYNVFRDEPEIVYPSAGTAYPTKKTFLRNDDDIEEFVSHFGYINHEILLDEHIAIRMAQSGVESGLNIGRIFGFRLFIECFWY